MFVPFLHHCDLPSLSLEHTNVLPYHPFAHVHEFFIHGFFLSAPFLKLSIESIEDSQSYQFQLVVEAYE